MAREEMADGLTLENLHGIWIALTTPFTADNRFDTGIVRRERAALPCGRVARGIYDG